VHPVDYKGDGPSMKGNVPSVPPDDLLTLLTVLREVHLGDRSAVLLENDDTFSAARVFINHPRV